MRTRGTSTTLSYVLTLSVATLLVSGLIFAGSTFVQDHREQVIRQELKVVGEHLANNVEQVDRYAGATETLEDARIVQRFPDGVTGSTYDVTLRGGSEPTLFLNSTDPSVRVQVELTTTAPVAAESVADGGAIAATCEVSGDDCDRIVIENA